MGVYIPGMEMPKSCAECDAEGHYENSYGDEYGFFCPFGYKAYTEKTRDVKRLDDCPLVPVPPHGRLVDMGEIEERIDSCCDDIDCSKTMCNECAVQIVMNKVFDAPTILPAEEGE